MKVLHALLLLLLLVLAVMMGADMVMRWVDKAQPTPLTTYEVTSDNGLLRSECKVYETGAEEEPQIHAVEYR